MAGDLLLEVLPNDLAASAPRNDVEARVGRCSRCGRPLRDPVSVQRGVGPICAARMRVDMAFKEAARQAGVLVTVNGQPLKHVIRHSPTGFEWGYGGSGPADLALSILTDYLHRAPSVVVRDEAEHELILARQGRQKLAELLHQGFKAEVIATLPHEGWRLTGQQVAEWLARHGVEATVMPVVYEGRRIA